MVDNFWRDKRVFITGANGFIGRSLAQALRIRGAQLIAFGRSNVEQDSKMMYVQGDIRDFGGISDVFQTYAIDTCFHLAAQPLVQAAFEDPLQTFQINIQGTTNILEAARRCETIQRVVIASTAHVYGDNKNLPFLEEYFPQPSRPYETSKACADILAQTYYYSYHLPVAILRSTNIYGPGDINFSRLVPKTMRAVFAKKMVEIVDGTPRRDYVYIKDVINAYMLLAEALHREEIKGQAFNIGSGRVFSARELAKIILTESKHDMDCLTIVPKRLEKEINEQYVSIKKAEQLVSWQPMFSIYEGIHETYEWYKTFLQK